MKKRNFLAILGLTLLVVVLFSSCTKNCVCKKWVNGKAGESYTIALTGNEINCSDKNTLVVVAGNKNGIECE